MKSIYNIGIVLLVIAGVVYVYLSGPQKPDGGGIYSLEYFDLNDELVDLDEYRGQPLVINSWAIWCTFCKEELPDFVQLQQELGDAALIIAINRGEPVSEQLEFLEGEGITDDLVYLQDKDDKFYNAIGGLGMPATIFINSVGETVAIKNGFMSINEMRDRVSQLIKEDK